MVRPFLGLCDRFREEREFVLPLPTLVYFITVTSSRPGPALSG
jgi:hypothetical protein